MRDLMLVFTATMLLAYCSEHYRIAFGPNHKKTVDLAFIAMILLLSAYCGLRTAYNDTFTYIRGFQNAVTPAAYLAQRPTLMGNPLFYLFQCFFRHYISDNYHLYLMTIAVFTITCYVCFIKKYAYDFLFSMVLFFTLLYLFPFAAVKQALAMAILTLAMDRLLARKYLWYYLLVFIAMLIHSYAFVFFALPIFLARPWTPVIYAVVAVIFIILITFESSITQFLEYSDGLGKGLEAETLLEQEGMNFFRVAVFGVPPLISFCFQQRFQRSTEQTANLMVNMSIISFLIVCMGAINAANMFGRSATYFIFGAIIGLPWIIRQIFTPKSAQFVKWIAMGCYLLFFLYDVRYFIVEYRAISILKFFATLIS